MHCEVQETLENMAKIYDLHWRCDKEGLRTWTAKREEALHDVAYAAEQLLGALRRLEKATRECEAWQSAMIQDGASELAIERLLKAL